MFILVFQDPFNKVDYSVIPFGDDNAHMYFKVDKETGEVRVAQDLTVDTETLYIVSK